MCRVRRSGCFLRRDQAVDENMALKCKRMNLISPVYPTDTGLFDNVVDYGTSTTSTIGTTTAFASSDHAANLIGAVMAPMIL